MTREQALRHIEINLITLYDIDENVIECNDAMEIIDQIFNDHEAIVKAKDEEIRRLNNLYADTIKDLGDALIEIAELKWDFDMQKKSATEMYRKNEDIDMLKESESHFFNALINERKQRLSLFDCLKKERKKARSIIAMLFWEWKKAKTHQKAMYFSDAFKQAYKILKEQQ